MVTVFDFYVSLRGELIGQIGGIENARHSLWWDNTRPNAVTHANLTKILGAAVEQSRQYGVFIVTRHCDCPNPRHPYYPTTNDFGIHIPYKDKKYRWEGGQLFQGDRRCACPCSPLNKRTEHSVIDDIIYDKKSDFEVCKRIDSVLVDISEAIYNAGDRQPRSGIREYLLRAVLSLNDGIMGKSIDDFIRENEADRIIDTVPATTVPE